MGDRGRWQYCQIEVGNNNSGVLHQFFPDRAPVETQLYDRWPGMLAKLGDQGWEMVSVVPGGGRAIALTYIFKRPSNSGSTSAPISAPQAQPQQATPTPAAPQVDYAPLYEDEEEDEGADFEPLRGLES